MVGRVFQQLVFRLVRLFYAQIEVRGRWPGRVPVIFVLNHPNGLLDPALVMAARLEKVTFLAKSTLFAMPVVNWLARQFGAVPIFRATDLGLRGGASDAEDMAARNEETFAQCRRQLHRGRPLALFPEGKTHDTPQLLPLRTGAARIALSAAQEAGWRSGLIIMPVGLCYEEMTQFRTNALLNIGQSINVDQWQQPYEEDAHQAVQRLTAQIEKRLEDTVLQAQSHRLLRGIRIVANWTAPDKRGSGFGFQLDWSARLLRAYSHLQIHAPERLQRIEASSQSFGAMLQTAGVSDPWDLRQLQAGTGYFVRRISGLILLLPPALLGALVCAIPWCILRFWAHRLHRALVGTIKLFSGVILSGLSIAAIAVALLLTLGLWWGVGFVIVAPLCMYAALRWHELYRATRSALIVTRLQRRRTPLVAHITQFQEELAEAVHDALKFAEEA